MKLEIKIRLICLATLLFMTGIIGTRPLIPLLASDLGAQPFQIGIIVSIFSFFPLLLAVKFGHWIDQVGTIFPLLSSVVLGAISLALPLLLGGLCGVYLSQVFAGIAQTIFALAAQSYIGSNSENSNRDKFISMFSLAIAGGGLIGPLVGGVFSDTMGYARTLFILGCVTILSLLIIILLKSKVKDRHTIDSMKTLKKENEKRGNVIELLKMSDLRKSFLISMVILLGRDIYIAYFPLLARGFGYSTTLIGIIIGLHNGAGLFIRILLTRIIRWWGKSEVAVFSILLSGIVYATLPITNNILFVCAVSILLGMLLGIGQPLSISTTIRFSPDTRVGETLGLRLTFNRLTQFTSPILFGGVAAVFSLNTIFFVVALILIIGSKNSFIKKESKKYAK